MKRYHYVPSLLHITGTLKYLDILEIKGLECHPTVLFLRGEWPLILLF